MESSKIKAKFDEDLTALKYVVHNAVVNEVVMSYRCFKQESFPYTGEHPVNIQESFQSIVSLYPNVDSQFKRHIKKLRITDNNFGTLRNRVCLFVELHARTLELESQLRDQLLSAVLEGGFRNAKTFLDDFFRGSGSSGKAGGVLTWFTHKIFRSNPLKAKDYDSTIAYVKRALEEAKQASAHISDYTFLSQTVNSEVVQNTVVVSMAEEAQSRAESYLKTNIPIVVDKLAESISREQEHNCISKVRSETASHYEEERRVLTSRLISRVNDLSRESGSKHIIHIKDVKDVGTRNPGYQIEGSQETEEDPVMSFTVYPLRLSEQDSQNLQFNPHTIFTPHFHGSYSFRLPLGFSIFGSEDILLVDSLGEARIFSLDTLQFRPATLYLNEVPLDVHSTPDGSCLLVLHGRGQDLEITAYHWSSFGSTEGTILDIPCLAVGDPFAVTSLCSRTSVHLLTLDFSARCLKSHALDITRRVTEFMFRESFNRSTSERAVNTAHNCLVDCHSDVWTRFPVLAAVQRETISSASLRSQSSLVFVTDRDFDKFAPYFNQMIHNFEFSSKKPTGDVLNSIKVSAAPFDVFAQELCGTSEWNTSRYCGGEWIVDLLCLIPIHIAVTRDNRFIPLKDGIYSPELEKELLGAEVNSIVDSISFGWYESLFQSYMATKPVRVVSSMGEQSVGKSYALNHLVDTSFAGSAMRTTEGVWMSVTPMDKEIIVALDFEGVHSIERSAQEDTLLVLFNTAISNLVLFRNNFALSRDITGLFQSFQSSASILDPAANPLLFQSTLVIIIKDVIEADSEEIGREFSLKFRRIVQDEQEANFITRLHRGKLTIIPWPVIESREFYKFFPVLKERLGAQVITHKAGGEFLHVMKTLMAKLKANDWGAMSQTMASHRAQALSMQLPNALAFGLQEVDPEREPLKNFDTDVPVELPDTPSILFLETGTPQPEARERSLEGLCRSWEQYDSRQHIPDLEWTENLVQYLEHAVNLRINHVEEWLNQNLSRFQTGHASIEELRRKFEADTVDLKSNIRLCKIQAGHAGKHVCVVNAHLCGEPCKLQGRVGCLDACTKVSRLCIVRIGHSNPFQIVGHVDDEHMCAAPVHACGEVSPYWYTVMRWSRADLLCRTGHPEQEHETRHGSMSRTRWTVDGPDGAALEIEGRNFSTNDEGAPMMCNLLCQSMGRHIHIDFCRADEDPCIGNDEIEHIWTRLQPEPDRPKDFITHHLFWKRSGENIS
ncbi:hypothetical protein ID866_8469 [Astraeus odoratus]|nr:hypothetical protein ID866_8469 [Astraeus odoratus]